MITPKGELNEVFREKGKTEREGGVRSKREKGWERTKGRKNKERNREGVSRTEGKRKGEREREREREMEGGGVWAWRERVDRVKDRSSEG